jgi:uncharacterized protein YjbI with pentapeptide repeats
MKNIRNCATLLALTCVMLSCGPLEDLRSDQPVAESDTPAVSQGEALLGENLAGTNLAGTNLAGNNLAGVNLAGANLGGTNLAGTNLAGTNLAGTNLAGNNLAGNNLAGTNLAGTNLAGTNLAGTNLAGTNLAGSNLGGTNLAGVNLAGTNLAGTNLAGANLSTSNVGKNIHNLANANGMLPSGEDLWSDRAHACVVAGLGSTAFSKLVSENAAITTTTITKTFKVYTPPAGTITVTDSIRGNYSGSYYTGTSTFVVPAGAFNLKVLSTGSAYLRTSVRIGTTTYNSGAKYGTGVEVQGPPAGTAALTITYGSSTKGVTTTISYDLAQSSKMYSAVAKTTWGVSNTPGGPKELDAWEVLVWGSKTYCSFVMFAPPTATFAGVAGFLKAIWRWNAPLSMSMDIGQIGGGVTVQTYRGFNNVAHLWSRGLVSEKAHIAGELALITATTNNVGVQADFFSWMTGVDKKPIRLSGPEGTAPNTEGSYRAIDTGQGTVAIVMAYPDQYFPIGDWDNPNYHNENAYWAKQNPLCVEYCLKDFAFDTIYSNLVYAGSVYSEAVAKRCMGWSYLVDKGYRTRADIPAGKCDDYVKFQKTDALPVSSRTYNNNKIRWDQAFPNNNENRVVAEYVWTQAPGQDWIHYGGPVISETYVFLYERSFVDAAPVSTRK